MDVAAAPAMDAALFRQLGHRLVDVVADRLAAIRSRPGFRPMPEAQRQRIEQHELPPSGAPAEGVVDWVLHNIEPYPMGNSHPRFFGWVNSPPAPIGILAELLAASMNPSCAGGDHAAVYVEHCAIRWLMELVGFPVEGSRGVLVSGGSTASLTCLAAARHASARRAGWNVRGEGMVQATRPMVLYVSEQGHGCLQKAAELLGVGSNYIRHIPVDDAYRMRLDVLRDAVQEDRQRGCVPLAVAASAGTVNTGAIDPLDALADFCSRERIWLHVDGAYGALGAAHPALRDRYAGLARVDSLALDPHKWLSVPVECGCALVRDGALLREAFRLVPAYLVTDPGRGFGGPVWFSEYGFQQTRGFRALKLWMTLKHLGRSGVSSLVVRHCELARQLADLIDRSDDFERVAPVELSIVCFRYVGWKDGLSVANEVIDARNKALMDRVQCGGQAFVSGTVLRGRFVMRACVLHYATTSEDVGRLLDIIREAADELGGAAEPPVL